MNKILSVIVPTYNMEKYLEQCLDSLIVDNKNSIEVLVINDGSTDRSIEIANSFQSRFPDVFKVVDKRNGNYGSCINRGLKEATGTYVKVLDADDSFDSVNFNSFITFLKYQNADLILSDFVIVNEKREITKEIAYNFGKTEFLIEEFCDTPRFKAMEMHAVAYRRNLLISQRYNQSEGISYTDQQWIFEPMSYISTVSVFNRPVYRYLIGREGQTMDSKVMIKKMGERIKMTMDMAARYNKAVNGQSNEIRNYILTRAQLNIYQIYSGYFFNESQIKLKDILEFDNYLKNTNIKLYKSTLSVTLWRIFNKNIFLNKLYCLLYSTSFKLGIFS